MSKRLTHQPIWLSEHGHDGLYALEGPCGCGLDDFAPCGDGPFPECVPAKLHEDGLFYPSHDLGGHIILRRFKAGTPMATLYRQFGRRQVDRVIRAALAETWCLCHE